MTAAEEVAAAIEAARAEGRDVPAVIEELLLALAARLDAVTPAK